MAVNLKNINELPEKVELTGEERVIISDDGVAKSVPASGFAKKDDGWDIILTVKSEYEQINIGDENNEWWMGYFPVLELKCRYEEVKQRFIEEAKIPKLLLLFKNEINEIIAANPIAFCSLCNYLTDDPLPIINEETKNVTRYSGMVMDFRDSDNLGIYIAITPDGQTLVSHDW